MIVALRVVAGLLLAGFFTADLFYDDDFLRKSSDISYSLQTWGGKPLRLTGLVFSYFFAFVQIPFAYYYFLFSKNQLKALYYFSLFTGPIVVGTWAKVFYYKGRPWAIREDVFGEACDPGMPSGHSIIATAGYFVIYKMVTEDVYPKNGRAKVIAGVACSLIAVCIMASRISLGDHGFNQVILGFLIAWNFILHFDYKVFVGLLHTYRSRLPAIMGCLTLFNVLSLVGMNYVNHRYREDPAFWKYIDKYKNCHGTFIVGSALSVPFNSWVFAAYQFYPFQRGLPESLPPLRLTNAVVSSRVFYHSVVLLPLLVFLLVEGLVLTQVEDLFLMSAVTSVVVTLAFMYAGYAMVSLSKSVLLRRRVVGKDDFIFVSDVEQQWNELRDLSPDEVNEEARDKLIGEEARGAGDMQT